MDDGHHRHLAVLAAEIAMQLPPADVQRLAGAATGGRPALRRLRGEVAGAVPRDACDVLLAAWTSDRDGDVLAGALLSAVETTRRHRSETDIDVVWTGPSSHVRTSRLTAAVITALIDDARSELLLVGFAVHTEPRVAEALAAAADRGVALTLLLERATDNDRYTGPDLPFSDLHARRLVWPSDQRPEGRAALHAKLLVADRTVSLVGSANITGWALDRNLECGLLVRDRRVAGSICAHVDGLLAAGVLRSSAAGPATRTVGRGSWS